MHRPSSRAWHALCIRTASAVLILGTIPVPDTVLALPTRESASTPAVPDIDRHIAEAAQRFGMPPHWIRAVITVESAGDPRAVSRAGAMGLMQIMPGTWAELRRAHGLGSDPFDPRDNILAGSAYLRAMYDRFGSPGFLAAYNAGPARYAEHLATGRPLPRETRDYLEVLVPKIGADVPVRSAQQMNTGTDDWRNAPLFAGASQARPDRADATASGNRATAQSDLFVPLQSRGTP
jgi:hypothetical protein